MNFVIILYIHIILCSLEEEKKHDYRKDQHLFVIPFNTNNEDKNNPIPDATIFAIAYNHHLNNAEKWRLDIDQIAEIIKYQSSFDIIIVELIQKADENGT